MSFEAKNLRPLGDNVTAGETPQIWLYFNADSDTVTTAGYIPAGYNVKAKDQVIVVPAAGTSVAWHYATVSNGAITLTAHAAAD